MLLSARKRLGVGTEFRMRSAALSGCAPRPNVSHPALGIPTPQGAQPQGAATRRYSAPQAVGLMGRSEQNRRYVGEAAQRALTLGTRANGLSTVEATGPRYGHPEDEQVWKPNAVGRSQ